MSIEDLKKMEHHIKEKKTSILQKYRKSKAKYGHTLKSKPSRASSKEKKRPALNVPNIWKW